MTPLFDTTHFDFNEVSNKLIQGFKPYLTLGEAISDLPFIKSNEKSFEYFSEPQNEFRLLMRKNSTVLMDHSSPKNNENLVKIMVE